MRTGAIAFVALVAAQASGFDTGPHYDMTRDATQFRGFSEYAIRMVQLQNWLVDFYSNDPTFPHKTELEVLHFDNLANTNQVRSYWNFFTDNARRAFQSAARANDPFRALTLLGITLHALQDFYTHSNWAEMHPPGARYNCKSWFDDPPPPNELGVYTGIYPTPDPRLPPLTQYHGSYGYGLNKDSYSRPRYDEAYVYAYYATQQWIYNVQKWVEIIRPGFFNSMRFYHDAASWNDLNKDHFYLYRISEWVRVPAIRASSDYIDGKWKGEFSGALTVFGWVSVDFLTYRTRFSREFTDNLRFREITPNLNNLSLPSPAIEPLSQVRLNQRVIYLRTVRVDDLNFWTMDPPWDLLDFDTLPDFYAVIKIDDQTFTEACRQITRTGPVNWLTLKLVHANRTTVNIRYEMWDEDANLRGVPFGGVQLLQRDEKCDVNPAAGKSHIDFTFNLNTKQCTGDVNGVFDAPSRTFVGRGTDGNNVLVEFYITVYDVNE